MQLLPKGIRNFRLNSVFFRILSFFMITILLSILIVGYVSYYNSANLLINEVKNSNMTVLNEARDVMDQELIQVEKLTLQVSMDKNINKIFFATNSEIDREPEQYVHYFSDIKNYLANLRTSVDFVGSLWIYFSKSKMVISEMGKYDSEFFFKEVYPYQPALQGQELFNKYSTFKLLENTPQNTDYIAFIRTIPINDRDPYGTLVINVKKSVIKNLLKNANNDIQNHLYVVDNKGNIILDNKSESGFSEGDDILLSFMKAEDNFSKIGDGFLNRRINNKLYTINVTTSQYNGWKYISITPNGAVMAKVNIIKKTIVIVILICLIIGLMLSYILSRRIYDPINRIINFIEMANDLKINKSLDKKSDEFSFINKMMSFVYEEYRYIEDALNKNKPLIKEKLIADLLDGRSVALKDSEITSALNSDFDEECFNVVAVFEIENSLSGKEFFEEDREINIEDIINLVSSNNSYAALKVYPVKRTDNKFAILINLGLNVKDLHIVQELIDEIIAYFKENYNLVMTVGIGREYKTLAKIKIAYEEALRALDYKIVKGASSIIHIEEVKEFKRNIFEYSMEKEQQIINTVKSGSVQHLNNLLDELFASNLEKEEMLPEFVYNFFNALAGTAVRIIYEINSTMEETFGQDFNIYKELNNYKTIEGKKKFITRVFEKTMNYIALRRNNQNNKVYERILSYIHDNYNMDISLNSVGDYIGLSIQYISSIFKETSGINFVDYLNYYRVEKAKELLKKSDISINEVGKKVGFNNSTNFIRVFKKYVRCTPGQFREESVS